MHFPIPLGFFLDFDKYRIIDQSMIVTSKFTLVITNNINFTLSGSVWSNVV